MDGLFASLLWFAVATYYICPPDAYFGHALHATSANHGPKRVNYMYLDTKTGGLAKVCASSPVLCSSPICTPLRTTVCTVLQAQTPIAATTPTCAARAQRHPDDDLVARGRDRLRPKGECLRTHMSKPPLTLSDPPKHGYTPGAQLSFTHALMTPDAKGPHQYCTCMQMRGSGFSFRIYPLPLCPI